jgi:very-short-patch-repair endonuclease
MYEEADNLIINSEREKKYKEALDSHKKELEVYKKSVEEILKSAETKDFRNRQKLELLQSSELPKNTTDDILSGRYEKYFLKYLQISFQGKIYRNIGIDFKQNIKYYPDFVYHDAETNLCIDIEIDEPYTYSGGEPIHCVGEDDFRNSFFLSKGWFVIRFAEKQVVENPDQCVNFIEMAISNILEGEIMINNELPEVNFWSYGEAKKLVEIGFRDTYRIYTEQS